MNKVGFTGHRPEKLGGYDDDTFTKLVSFSINILEENKIKHANIGMALGFDQSVAFACVYLNIPFSAFIPFKGQENKWPNSAKERYLKVLREAKNIIIVSEGEYASWKMQIRNEAIVNNSDKMICLWDGSDSGTGNCVKYAKRKNIEVINVWDKWINFKLDK